MFAAYKLNKQGDNILVILLSQIWTTLLFHAQSNYCFLTCIQVSQKTGKVVWYSHLLENFPQFVVNNTVKRLSVVNEAEVDVFLEFSYFFYDPMNFGNLISGSSAFCKPSLYIRKVLIHILLKPSLKDFEHYHASTWNKHDCVVVWTFFGIAFLWIEMKTDLFQSREHCWDFQICWHVECSTWAESSFRILNSSARIILPPLAFVLSNAS